MSCFLSREACFWVSQAWKTPRPALIGGPGAGFHRIKGFGAAMGARLGGG